jgi:DNA-binding NarL/FixJ family response regulator
VLALIADGLSNGEISDRLFISESTVKTHINNLFAKAALRSRAQAVTYAYRHDLARPERG